MCVSLHVCLSGLLRTRTVPESVSGGQTKKIKQNNVQTEEKKENTDAILCHKTEELERQRMKVTQQATPEINIRRLLFAMMSCIGSNH